MTAQWATRYGVSKVAVESASATCYEVAVTGSKRSIGTYVAGNHLKRARWGIFIRYTNEILTIKEFGPPKCQ